MGEWIKALSDFEPLRLRTYVASAVAALAALGISLSPGVAAEVKTGTDIAVVVVTVLHVVAMESARLKVTPDAKTALQEPRGRHAAPEN